MATQPHADHDLSLDIPEKFKGRWLKQIFEFSDTEVAHVLGISVETVRKWLKDEADTHAVESARFQRLLNLTRLAKGVIRPSRMGHGIHHENRALGRLVPLNLLADAAGYERWWLRLLKTSVRHIRLKPIPFTAGRGRRARIPISALRGRHFWRCLPRQYVPTVLEAGPSFTAQRRYSARGEFGALYFSASAELALSEVASGLSHP